MLQWIEDIVYQDKLLCLAIKSDSSLEEEVELSEVVTSGANLFGEGVGTTAILSLYSTALSEFSSILMINW